MKHLFVILSCIMLCSSSLFASENDKPSLVSVYQKPTTSCITTPTIISELAIDLNAKINRKYSHGPERDFFDISPLPEDTMVDIFTITSEQCHSEDQVERLSELLCRKNTFFKKSANYFTNKALDNIKKTTSRNIATIEDPTLQQPESILNMLSPLFKHYVMSQAKNKVDKSYEMTLTGHTDEIYSFDLHSSTGQVITSSKDKTIRLWDLNNGGNCITTLEASQLFQHCICFNKTGSCVAGLELHETDYSTIKQWKINDSFGLEQTHTGTYDDHPGWISYLTDNCLMVVYKKDYSTDRNQLVMNEMLFNDSGIFLSGSTSCLASPLLLRPIGSFRGIPFDQEGYCAKASGVLQNGNSLSVTKKNCYELYLCEQAIKNTQQRQLLGNITTTNTYTKLTDYEKEMVNQQIQTKMAALKAMSKKLSRL